MIPSSIFLFKKNKIVGVAILAKGVAKPLPMSVLEVAETIPKPIGVTELPQGQPPPKLALSHPYNFILFFIKKINKYGSYVL
jgi:hypothetical protein